MRHELWSSMKSRLPEYRVAITGVPSAIASAKCNPSPSDRCRETTASVSRSSAIWSARLKYSSTTSVTLPRPLAATRNRSNWLGLGRPLVVLMINSTSLRSCERTGERLDATEGVLALDDAEEVERAQEDEAVLLDAERASITVRRRPASRAGGKGAHGLHGDGLERIAYELGADPDLVDMASCPAHVGRNVLELPEPVADGVAIGETPQAGGRRRGNRTGPR